MKKIFRIFVLIYLIFGIFSIANANNYKIIGENNNLIFNIEAIWNNEFKNEVNLPKYFSSEQKIEWIFWIKNIGPVKMENVKINCLWDKTKCNLQWNWTNYTIWNIDFKKGVFNSINNKFSGIIETNIGNFSLENISLGLDWDLTRKIFIAGENNEITLNNNFGEKTITITFNSVKYSWKWNKVKVPLTISGNYTIKVEIDWEIKNFPIIVNPGSIAIIEMKQEWSSYAGWEKKIIFTPKDKFENIIRTGKIKLEFSSKTSNNQTNLNLNNNWSQIVTSPQNVINNEREVEVKNWKAEILIKSAVPDDNKIILKKIFFNWIEWKNFFGISENDKKIFFKNPIEITTKTEEYYSNEEHELEIKLNKKSTNIKNIKIIVEYATIGSSSEFKIENSSNNYKYKNTYPERKSIWKEINFAGNETKIIKSTLETIPSKEKKIKTEINIFAQYTTNITGQDKIITTLIKTINNDVENNNPENIENLKDITSESQKAKLWNTVRKNIAYLKRNTTSYDWKNYIISDENIEIWNNIDRETYITTGADIIINENIFNNKDTPIAIIATNSNGKGGNILIAENVTNLEWVVLMADKIKNYNDNKKDKQLYIFGSVFAENSCMDKNKDCLPKLRENYKRDKNNKKINTAEWEIAEKYPHIKVILQYNPKLYSNPPIGLAEIVN